MCKWEESEMLCMAWASRDLVQLTQLYSSIVVLAIGHAINEWIVAYNNGDPVPPLM
jgi:hypothetical protein